MNQLQQGGYILYTRHAEATIGEDLPNLNFEDCSTQRNLSDLGRWQASSYGITFRNLQIPVQIPVITSPFCRSIETAMIAFGNTSYQVDPFWVEVYHLSADLSIEQTESIIKYFYSLLEIKPPAGQNKVIIAHSFPNHIGLGPIPNMGIVMIEPLGQGKGFNLISRFTLRELEMLDGM